MKMLFATALMASVLGSAPVTSATFDGNTCLGDCSGHQAGYDWAEQNDVDDESSCSTPSPSFNQGCESYVEENAASVSDDEDDEDE
ncbi:hypothetical protein [Pseudomonas sp. MC6]